MTLTSKSFNEISSSVGIIVELAPVRAFMWSFVFIYFLFTVVLFFFIFMLVYVSFLRYKSVSGRAGHSIGGHLVGGGGRSVFQMSPGQEVAIYNIIYDYM